jgi:hypothetical protein
MNLAKSAFTLSSALLVFGLGFAVDHYQVFPYSVIRAGMDSARRVLDERQTLARTRPEQLTRLARHTGNGVTRNEEGRVAPGLTLISSFFDGLNEIRLVRLDGSVVNRWPLHFFEIFPNLDHLQQDRIPKSDWNLSTHGAVVLPDGSLAFNFESLGTVKLDRCGAVQWTVARETNHSLEPSQDGGFWVPERRWVRENSPFPLLKPPYAHDQIVKLSADGKVLSEISVLGLFFKNHMEALLFSNGMPGPALPSDNPLHLNDVEELGSEKAADFPQFSAHDLLVSLRNLNLVMVVDPTTEKIKWYHTGPWIAQHDPDFHAGGTITVFNNNNDGTSTGSILGGSQIVEIDPATGDATIRYGAIPEQRWYSQMMGKHQNLPNGNTLIAESEAGRIIEVTPDGDIVWEFVNRWDDQYVTEVWDADRYPESYFTVTDWTCDNRVSSSP